MVLAGEFDMFVRRDHVVGDASICERKWLWKDYGGTWFIHLRVFARVLRELFDVRRD